MFIWYFLIGHDVACVQTPVCADAGCTRRFRICRPQSRLAFASWLIEIND
jgi:hypothetical protein